MSRSTPQSVLHIVLNEFTHDARVRRAAEASASAGFDTEVLALHAEGHSRLEDTGDMVVYRVRLASKGWSKRRLVQGFKYLEAVVRMVRIGRRLRPDLVHANDLPTLPVALAIAAGRGTRVVYDAHELWTESTGMGRFPRWVPRVLETVERFGMRRVSGRVTVSPGIAERLAGRYDVPPPAVVRNMPPPVTSEVGADRGRGPLRRQLDLPAATPVVLYQGGISPGRGLLTLARSATLLDHPEAVVVFLGDGPVKAAIEQEVAGRGLQDRVLLHPAVPLQELPEWTADATIGVHPIQPTGANHVYCLPNKLFEYIQAGLPVVMTDLPDIRRIVEEYGVGEVVEPGSEEAMAYAVNRLLGDPTLYQQYAAAAREASRELHWGRERERLLGVYREVLGGSG